MINSIINNNIFKTEELKKNADKAEKPEDATEIVKQYEDIICTKKRNITSVAYHPGKVY